MISEKRLCGQGRGLSFRQASPGVAARPWRRQQPHPWFQPPNPGGGNPPFHNAWRVNGDRVPVSPLFPMGYGLSYTAFGFADATIDAASIPAEGLNGTALAKTMLKVRVAVSNTGERAGATPIIVTFSK